MGSFLVTLVSAEESKRKSIFSSLGRIIRVYH